MKANDRIGLAGVDTRALTRRIRLSGAPNAAIAHDPEGNFDIDALLTKAQSWPGLEGMDLAIEVTGKETRLWNDGVWRLGFGYGLDEAGDERPHVVAIDYGAKRHNFRNLIRACPMTPALPATARFVDVKAQKTTSVFLSHGPGNPAESVVSPDPEITKKP